MLIIYSMSSKTSSMAGGPIISISDMDNFMRIGESAQCARSQRPIKRTSSMDFDLLRASGDAARRRRGSTAFEGSTCASPSHTPTASTFQSTRSTPCSSPSLRPLEPRESRCDFLLPAEITTLAPWKLTMSHSAWAFDGNRDSCTGLDVHVGSRFEMDAPFEIGVTLTLRIVDMEEGF